MTKEHSEHQAIRPEVIDAEIGQIRKIKGAVAELRTNGYRVDRSPGIDGRPQYLVRAGNRQTAKSGANTCSNHSWRPAKEGDNCRLCIRQKKMHKRWETNRRALATIRRSSTKCLPTAKPGRASSVDNQRRISHAASTIPPAATLNLHIMVGFDWRSHWLCSTHCRTFPASRADRRYRDGGHDIRGLWRVYTTNKLLKAKTQGEAHRMAYNNDWRWDVERG